MKMSIYNVYVNFKGFKLIVIKLLSRFILSLSNLIVYFILICN